MWQRPARLRCMKWRASAPESVGYITYGMHRTREPAVAGSFYSAVPTDLHDDVAKLLAAAPGGPAPKAVIAPQA